MIRVPREAKVCPAWVQEHITRAGGRNGYGEPNFRLVWGWTRLAWICGKWEDKPQGENGPVVYNYENRKVPKYMPFDRWHLEKYHEAAFYGNPLTWAARTEIEEDNGMRFLENGPYPARGDYEHVRTIEGDAGEYLELRPSLVALIVKIVVRSRILVAQDKAKSLEAIKDREKKVEKDWDSYADDVLGDAFPAFGLGPRVFMGGIAP